jgi:hypothetical protein
MDAETQGRPRRKRLSAEGAPVTWVRRGQIDPGNVDKIIDEARHGYE